MNSRRLLLLLAVAGMVVAAVWATSGNFSLPKLGTDDRLAALEEQVRAQATVIAQMKAAQVSGTPTGQMSTADSQTAMPTPSADVAKMAEVLSVEVTAINYLPADASAGRLTPSLQFTFVYHNRSQKDIQALRGDVVLTDLFGKQLMRLRLTSTTIIPAGKKVEDPNESVSLSPFFNLADLGVRNPGNLRESIKVVFEPISIIFTDGTQLGSV
jgi:hypothetical protein